MTGSNSGNRDWQHGSKTIAGVALHVARAGQGAPLLVLHHDTGTLDDIPLYAALARHRDVILPHHPGWGRSERPAWMRSVRDVAVMYRALLAELGIERVELLGLGFGGWIAAEMATMAPRDVARATLVGPMGIAPTEGYIFDQAIVSYIDYARAGFHDQARFDALYGKEPSTDQLVEWDIAREMCFRIAWKPYMYSHTLPHLLGAVTAPTTVVWGAEDRIVPVSTATAWQAALPAARLEIVPGAGHCVDMEQPEGLARIVLS